MNSSIADALREGDVSDDQLENELPEAPVMRQTATQFSTLPLRALAILGLHIPLGIAMRQFPSVATAHAALTMAIGLYVAMGPRVERIVYAAAYFCGSEVLWRMAHARSPWEFGKYGVIVLFLIGLIRQRPFRIHWPSLAFLLLLLPSAALTMLALDAHEARSQIAFNLAGPVALAISVWFLATVDLGAPERRRVVLALLAPLVSIVTITAVATYLVGGVKFGTESNFASSGGFGPNQVSGILGFGALAALLASFDRTAGQGFRLIMVAMTLALTVQSAMTFSRGGLTVAGVAALAAFLHLMRDRGSRVRLLLVLVTLIVGGVYVVVPQLDSFTGGALSARFEDHNLTKRDDVVRDDIDIWMAYPILGVGPGMAKSKRVRSNVGAAPVAAHTEFSRLLAEHGVLGLIALVMLLVICIKGWKRAGTAHTRALATGYLTWGMLFMLESGMRIVAPSLALGLAYAVGRRVTLRNRASNYLPEWMGSAQLIVDRARDASGRSTVPVSIQRADTTSSSTTRVSS